MNERTSKIGFSGIGGIFIGRNIKSEFHKHYALSMVISFGKPFMVYSSDHHKEEYRAVLIQKNIAFRLETSKDEYVACIHIVPYSDSGIRLTKKAAPIKELQYSRIQEPLSKIKDWYFSDSNDSEEVEEILNSVSHIFSTGSEKTKMDKRVYKALKIIMQNQEDKLQVKDVAKEVNLSVSHFNRLFKEETGLTFRRFALHGKLIKSINAIHKDNNLTQASFIGGFSDQPHFTRTFKKNFGIKPSETLK